MGNVTRAENRDSWIRRSYHPNGLLKGDTLRVRTVAELAEGGDSTSHKYALLHVYDLNGRRVELHHPHDIAPRVNGGPPLPSRYGYDPLSGALNRVVDPLGNEFRYVYNARGEQEALSLPGGISEQYGYDADGNLISHRVHNGAPSPVQYRYPGTWLRDETLRYDDRGKLLHTANVYGHRDTLDVQYTGLGHMALSEHTSHGTEFITGQPARSENVEAARHDALGNIYWMKRSQDVQTFKRSWLDAGSASGSWSNNVWTYQTGTARLLLRMTPNGVDSTHYDLAGNIRFTNQSPTTGGTAFDRASFYDGENRLRVSETRRVENYGARTAPYYLVVEEYRYDALGRRIMVYTRKDCLNTGATLKPCAVGSLRRTVWDGSAELYDIQVPVSSDNTLVNVSFTASEMENDTARVRSNLGNWEGFDPYPMYGRVAYTYGHAIDRPLSIVRMNYADHPAGAGYHAWVEPFSIIPHWNMRGAAQTGTFANGARDPCEQVNGATRCVYIDWPDAWFPYNPVRIIPEFWHGSLLSEKRDGSGLLYRRNRYYDPSSSRFTQEDPIGLAGGLNVYGFAEGDPVSYSDPYGLSASSCCTFGYDTGLRGPTRAEFRRDLRTAGRILTALVVGPSEPDAPSGSLSSPGLMDPVGWLAGGISGRLAAARNAARVAPAAVASPRAIRTLDDVIADPSLLAGRAPGQLLDAIESSPNWVRGTMGRSMSRPGEGVTLREVNEAGISRESISSGTRAGDTTGRTRTG
ncbi:MAG TPA: RHS repeat-associated core domain-containing protein, partial [Longimicrobium sp.]|nr:RHS repeat-associated core domain-containing protein [Longimicrobium sp.]